MKEYKGLKFPKNVHKYTLDSSKSGCAIVEPDTTGKIGCQDLRCRECIAYEDKHNTAILKEYLNEGEKDVSEFKKGDLVECVEDVYDLTKGVRDVIDFVYKDGTIAVEGSSSVFEVEYFKLVKKKKKKKAKTQTTKENNMNINSSIRIVLVEENKETFETVEKFQKVFGAEIAENFTGTMILRKNIKAYNDEIKRLDDIEAERIFKEEKDK